MSLSNLLIPTGSKYPKCCRFLKAKLSACQAQLEEALAAHYSSQLEAADMRKQVYIVTGSKGLGLGIGLLKRTSNRSACTRNKCSRTASSKLISLTVRPDVVL